MFKNGLFHKLNHIPVSMYGLSHQTISSIAIQVLHPVPFRWGEAVFFSPLASPLRLSFVHLYKHFGSGENFDSTFYFG